MRIYLDHHATTPVDPRVLEAMLPYFAERFGNPASRSHAFGWEAEEAVEAARRRVAGLIGADPREIVFTSGATEANNLALLGAAEALRGRGDRILASPIEHPSVHEVLLELGRRGFRIDYLPVDRYGRVDPGDVARAITSDTVLVTVMAANHEIGTVQPLPEIGRIVAERGLWFHSDATQAVGKIEFDAPSCGVHLASLSGHKIYGPKGCGALFVRRRGLEVRPRPLQFGGDHERGLRPGTLNVPGIVGLGSAAEICSRERDREARRIKDLRDRLLARLREGLDGVRLNGPERERLPGNLNVCLAGTDAETLMSAVPEVAVSTGAACTTGRLEPSRILRAVGLTPADARTALRFGLGRSTTAAEVERAAELFVEAAGRLRSRRTR